MNHTGEISHLKQYIGWHLYIHVNGSYRSCLKAPFLSRFTVKETSLEFLHQHLSLVHVRSQTIDKSRNRRFAPNHHLTKFLHTQVSKTGDVMLSLHPDCAIALVRCAVKRVFPYMNP